MRRRRYTCKPRTLPFRPVISGQKDEILEAILAEIDGEGASDFLRGALKDVWDDVRENGPPEDAIRAMTTLSAPLSVVEWYFVVPRFVDPDASGWDQFFTRLGNLFELDERGSFVRYGFLIGLEPSTGLLVLCALNRGIPTSDEIRQFAQEHVPTLFSNRFSAYNAVRSV